MKKFLSIAMASILLMATSVYSQTYQNRTNQQNGRPTHMNQKMRQPNDPPSDNYGRHKQNNNRQFSRGKRAPDQFRQPKYYVNDWQAQRLKRPPSGYRWVRNDNNQFILIVIATGIIAQVITGNNNQTYRTWHNGENLPRQYRSRNYYVNDWGNRGLSHPSKGRRWVHVNHQYLLININGGQIRAAVSTN